MKKSVICIDRDGTLIHDDKYYLGRDDDWRSKVSILPQVIEGLTKIRQMPNTAVYMITNQPGVAIGDYPLLTMERAHEVCRYVVDRINEGNRLIDGYFLCPHASPEYVRKKKGVNFDEWFVHRCKCLKPALGMVLDSLKAANITADAAHIYVIGDRVTDVQTALNIGGYGILIPFANEPGQEEKARLLEPQSHVTICRDMLEAAGFIATHEKS